MFLHAKTSNFTISLRNVPLSEMDRRSDAIRHATFDNLGILEIPQYGLPNSAIAPAEYSDSWFLYSVAARAISF
jgi:hypothetical protein